MNDFYEQKAQKYKYKYLKLKELEGGVDEKIGNYENFRNDMNTCLRNKLEFQSFYYPTLNPEKNGYEYKDNKNEHNLSHIRTAQEDGRYHRPSGEYKVLQDTNNKLIHTLIAAHPHKEQPTMQHVQYAQVQHAPVQQTRAPMHPQEVDPRSKTVSNRGMQQAPMQYIEPTQVPSIQQTMPPTLFAPKKASMQHIDLAPSMQAPSMQPMYTQYAPAQPSMQYAPMQQASMHPMQQQVPMHSMHSMQVQELAQAQAPSMYSMQQPRMPRVVTWGEDVYNQHSIIGKDGRGVMSQMPVQQYQQGGSALSSTSSEDFLAE
jgi:hypothetical protein